MQNDEWVIVRNTEQFRERVIQSVYCLCLELTMLRQDNNLFAANQQERGQYFFVDNGIPVPRPCTALAWASLCAFGPALGFARHGTREIQPMRLDRGHFLIPFLPKLAYQEEQSHSLPRISKLHERDSDNNIIWGPVMIGESSTGQIVQQLQHGQYVAKEWIDEKPKGNGWLLNPPTHNSTVVPPLYAEAYDMWQFGIIQNLPNLAVTLRDPMIQLSIHGVPMSRRWKKDMHIRKLLFRFLDTMAASEWAQSYAEAMSRLTNDSVQADQDLLLKSIRAKQNESKEAVEKKKGKRKLDVDFFALTPSRFKGDSNDSESGTKQEQNG